MTLLLALSLASRSASAADAPPTDRVAVAGVEAPALGSLLDEHWRWAKARWPELAVRVGDQAGRGRFTDRSPAALAAEAEAIHAQLERARALDPSAWSAADRETLAMFVSMLEADVAELGCRFDEWRVSPRSNALARANVHAGVGADLTTRGAARVIEAAEHVPVDVEESIAGLRLGLAAGRVADRRSVELVLAALDAELARPVAQWAMTAPARAPHPEWRAEQVSAFSIALLGATEARAKPALGRYARFLREEVLPVARDPSTPGLAGLPAGSACYAAMVEAYTDAPADPSALATLGHAELDRIEAAMLPIGATALGTDAAPALFERLRTDPALHFRDADEIESAAQDAVLDSQKQLRRWFTGRPRAELVVERVPDWRAEEDSAAYYAGPPPHGGTGTYYVNTSRPEDRPRFEARALAFHEGVPGHHLETTLGVRDTDLPAFRRFLVRTPLTEGWALYAEGLAEEMGLYEDDLDRLGRLSMAALRAARLVVDTGLHAEGWSREEAVAFLLAHTALGPREAAVEVERYLDLPGQALTYLVGERAIWALRRDAEARMGPAFDIRAFHAVLLGGGEVTLPIAKERVERWITAPATQR